MVHLGKIAYHLNWQFPIGSIKQNGILRPKILSTQKRWPYLCWSFIDINNDSLLDIYIINDFGHVHTPNQVLLQTDNGFVESPDHDLSFAAFGMGLGIGDLNEDGFPDFFITDWGRNILMESDGDGGWYDSTLQRNIIPSDERQQLLGVQNLLISTTIVFSISGFLMGHSKIKKTSKMILMHWVCKIHINNPMLYSQQEDGLFLNRLLLGLDRETTSRGGVWADLNKDGVLI